MADDREPTVLVLPDKRRAPGRPRSPEPHVHLSTWLPTSVYDRLCREAQQRDQSLSRLVAEALKEMTRTKDGDRD